VEVAQQHHPWRPDRPEQVGPAVDLDQPGGHAGAVGQHRRVGLLAPRHRGRGGRRRLDPDELGDGVEQGGGGRGGEQDEPPGRACLGKHDRGGM
ncbi:hypothetical protein DF186_14930, partial [Enterococcus hirae]